MFSTRFSTWWLGQHPPKFGTLNTQGWPLKYCRLNIFLASFVLNKNAT